MSTANAKYGLRSVTNHIECAREFFMTVLVPWMALAAEDDVRRPQFIDTIQIYLSKRLHPDLYAEKHSTEGRPQFARAVSLAIDGVID
jgi:hypothetical protein